MDIPLSISLAQHLPSTIANSSIPLLRSARRPKQPYPSTEPKTDRAKASVARHGMSDADVNEDSKGFPLKVLTAALEEIRDWTSREDKAGEDQNPCRRRWHFQSSPETLETGEGDGRVRDDVEADFAFPGSSPWFHGAESFEGGTWRCLDPLIIDSAHQQCRSEYTPKDLRDRLIRSSGTNSTALSISFPGPASEKGISQTYTIPPLSSCLLSKITATSTPTFSMAAYTALPSGSSSAGPARRSRTYELDSAENDSLTALLPVLGDHVATEGLVGLWITNRRQGRRKALEAFNAWNVQLVEEWAWLKVTVNGEPMSPLDGVWRKPFEILLLGKKRPDGVERNVDIRHRVIVAVPDVHSRKPCLKEIIDVMTPNRDDYRALEIFGRNLVAGWWTWGDEVLRYNWDGYWSSPEADLPDLEENGPGI